MNPIRFVGDLLAMARKKMSNDERSESRKDRATRLEISALQCICHELRKLNEFLRAVKSFEITQQGESMGTINGIKQGGVGTFVATPLPAGSDLQGIIPKWASSDPVNTALTPSPDGLSVNVAVGAGAAVGSSFTLTVTAVSPDGTVTATGTATVPVLAPAATFPTSFDINQTA